MNKYLIITLFILLAGCTKFLKEDSKSLIPTENFYSSAAEASRALYGSYGQLRALYQNRGVAVISDLAADIVGTKAASELIAFDNFSFDASNSILNSLYTDNYTIINSVNTLLYKIENKDLGNADTQKSIVGEAKFIRALCYFNLVTIFGDVPLRTDPVLNLDGLDLPRSPENEVYAQIVKDLNEGITLLKEGSVEKGRANRISAQALLAKVFLTMHQYNQALPLLQATMGKRSLYPAFADNFKLVNENNTVESIFEIQFGLRPNNNDFIAFFAPKELTKYGNAFGTYFAEDDYINSFEANDKRKDATIWFSMNGTVFPIISFKKFNDALIPGVQTTDAGQINFPILRYADILLMYAEVVNAINIGPTTEAYAAINQVRKRAGLENLPTGLSKNSFLDAVLEERKKEFGIEGQRWFDLKRNDKLSDKLGAKGFKSGKNEVWPIPQAALDANKNLSPTKGY